MGEQGSQGLLSPFLQRQRVAAARPYISGRILDIGSGNGVLASFTPPSDYLGIDRNEAALSIARTRYPRHVFQDALPNPSPEYDTVVALAVIEHIPEPREALLAWSHYMKPGGKLVLTTPHPAWEWSHEVGASIGVFSHDAAEEHEEMLDQPKMDALLQDTGLKVTVYRRFLLSVNQLFIVEHC